MKGRFFVFEGVDGSGKTTQAKKFAEYLQMRGRNVVQIRDPGSTEVAEEIRAIIKSPHNGQIGHKTQMFLFEAARAEMVEKIILLNLEAGIDVVCDRFTDSTLVYQSIMNGLDVKDLQKLNDYATNKIKPTLTFYFLSDYETFKKRVKSRGEAQDNVEIRITKEIFDQMNDFYQEMFLSNWFSVCVGSEMNSRETPETIAMRVRMLYAYFFSPSDFLSEEAVAEVIQNGGYCPCGTISAPETLCPCQKMLESHKCKCNLFF